MSDAIVWSRLLRLCFAIFVVAMVVVAAPIAWHSLNVYLADRVAPTVPDERELSSILAAVFDELEFKGLPPPPGKVGDPPRRSERKRVMLIDVTIPICTGARCELSREASAFLPPGGDARIPAMMRREFVAANDAAVPFRCPTTQWVECERPEFVAALTVNHRWWAEFYDRRANMAGVAWVSLPVLSRDGKLALVYVEFRPEFMGGFGQFVLLSKVGGKWTIALGELLWMS